MKARRYTTGRRIVGFGRRRPARVVIAGAGVAALEAMLSLSGRAGAGAAITMVAPEARFAYRPLTIAGVAGGAVPALDLDALTRLHGVARVAARVAAVEPDRREVRTDDGAALGYDALIVATGVPRRRARPGTLTLGDPADLPAIRALVAALASGARRAVAFAVPGRFAWSVPIYELALLAAARAGGGSELTIVTPELAPVEMMGTRASAAVAALLAQRGVRFRGSTFPLSYEHGALTTAPQAPVPADAVISVAELEPAPLPGLPAEPRGFVRTDELGRADARDDLFVVGEASAHRVRQGGLAAQQADAAASAIAAAIDPALEPEPFRPVLRAALLTGDKPLYMRTELHGRRRQELADRPLWWPPVKIAARHLGPALDARGVGRAVASGS